MAVILDLELPLVVRTHASGTVYAFALGAPDLVCRAGTREEAITTQTLFLREHLARVDAEAIAGFAFPPTTTLLEIPVALRREDLPPRFDIDGELAIPCVCVPDGTATWVHVLPLGEVIYVAPGESTSARVVEEVERRVAARELDDAGFLRLLPVRSQQLVFVPLRVERPEIGDAGRRAAARRDRAGRHERNVAQELLRTIGDDRLAAIERGLPPVVGREPEIQRLAALLAGEERTCVVLVGPPQVGKTAVLDAMLLQHAERFRNGRCIASSGAGLVAGQSGFGELSQRVQQVMRAAERLDAVLYFDNLADLFAGKSGGVEDLAANMRSAIVEGRVRIIGECTASALEQFEKQHGPILSCFHRVDIAPLSAARSHDAVLAHDRFMAGREPTHAHFDEAAIAPLVELCERYLPERALPGSAVRLWAELRAIHQHDIDDDGTPHRIGAHDVHRAFSLRTGIPMFLLRDDERMRRDALAAEFRRRVIGQPEAIERVIDTLCTIKARLQPPGKPLANFLFVGPTGVGKTEVAKTLARILFGAEGRMVRFDMSEYADPWAAERLIRGTTREDGELTRRVRQQPFCVLLLDEIEKAHRAVFDLLLQVLGEGRLTDARGQTTHFANTIVIMTSNLGASHRPHGDGPGFGGAVAPRGEAERAYYLAQIDRHFRPEFVNRIDAVIPFASLDTREIAEVARVSLQRIRERRGLTQRDIDLVVTEPALARLAQDGYSPTYGARALRRHLEDHLVAPLARVLSLAGAEADGARVVIAAGDLEAALAGVAAQHVEPAPPLQVAWIRGPGRGGAAANPASRGLDRIARLRRSAAAAVRISRVEDLHQRMAYLTAELASASRHDATTVAALREHERARVVLSRLDDAVATLETIEDLALAAEAEREPLQELVVEAERAHAGFEVDFVHAMFEGERRDAITLVGAALDELEALALWLRCLDAWSTARAWTVTLHRAGEHAPPWPPLPWGPPHTLAEALHALDDPRTAAGWRGVLVRVRGEFAGNLLALEAGLHRVWPAEGLGASHLELRALTWRAELGTPELGAEHFAPLPYKTNEQPHRRAALRDRFADGVLELSQLGLTTAPDVDLADPATVPRLWFGEFIRRVREGLDLQPELPE